MIESSDLPMTRIPLAQGAGLMPALGFGTLIPDAALTITATRDALEADFDTSIARNGTGTSAR
jgi:alcohol dehydrogenase (NADP+)